MAPPGNFTVKQLNTLKAKAMFMHEDKRKEYVFENIPQVLKDELVEFVVESGEVELEWDEMFSFLERRVSLWDQRTSIVVKVDRVMNDEEKLLMKILYIHKIPRGVKSRLDDIYALPDFGNLYKTARKADLRFDQREHFGRRNSDRDERNDVRGKVDFKKFQERSKNSISDSKSGKGMGISLRKKDNKNDESGSSVFKTYFTCRSKDRVVKTFITFNRMKDIKFEVGVDTRSEVSILTLKDFDCLNDEMKNKLVSKDWIFTKSWYGSHSKVIGLLEDFIDIDNVNVKSVKAKFYVAEVKNKVVVDEFGIEYSKRLPRVEKFLKESSSRVLVDDMFDPGNVLEAEFSVCDSFVPKRAGIIPIPGEYRSEVEEIFKRKIKNG
uniref:Reverse transcriptase domain-containing protein n=1 Tax=Strongyloides papillosus TaxID=174720 RepID=A0A0N5C6J8_STREA